MSPCAGRLLKPSLKTKFWGSRRQGRACHGQAVEAYCSLGLGTPRCATPTAAEDVSRGDISSGSPSPSRAAREDKHAGLNG